MDEDWEGVCADSQHENVLMGMELAVSAENQVSELPIYRQLERSRGQKSAGRCVFRPPVLPFLASHRRSYLRPVVDRSCVLGHRLGAYHIASDNPLDARAG
jgi:hypothetical protein